MTRRRGPRRVYLADLHLEDADGPRFARFAECLEREAHWADALFILGDLFEFWIGDDDDSELAEYTCAALRGAAARAELRFLPGNRDFLCGEGFARRSGARLIEDPHRTADGLLLAHGDALCTDDSAYQEWRAHARAPAWKDAMLAKPLAERRRLGAELRAQSRKENSNKAERIMDANPAAAAQLAERHDARTLIHGHTHRPGVHRAAWGTRYVLGNWERCGWLLRQTGATFQLECFPLAHARQG